MRTETEEGVMSASSTFSSSRFTDSWSKAEKRYYQMIEQRMQYQYKRRLLLTI